ncbi:MULTISPECIES: ChrR family anti-sigma-E factor [unclassified Lentilitoribacter]|jgi:putative transcriptional regulator|uniref:ChrR family anti-sigma-E factor n=1 Tax=unclassified Lentilitoribacter TaxID=2647570 RepID=UPI0013A68F88|nr:ChrR family anti-sigma-E factor [Lentilitoribacter sp. Alg239-R112]
MSLSQIDAIDTLLGQYASGGLSKPASILVEAHLELKSENRRFVRDLETVAGGALEQLQPTDLLAPSDTLAAIFASSGDDIVDNENIIQSGSNSTQLPSSLRRFVGYDVDDIPWRSKLPGFKEYDLGEVDGCHVNMFWIRPGRTVPAHTHKGCELSIVLDGAFTDQRGRFGKGDISIADASVDHRPKAGSDRPCIGFAVLEDGVKLTGSWGQLVGDLIG